MNSEFNPYNQFILIHYQLPVHLLTHHFNYTSLLLYNYFWQLKQFWCIVIHLCTQTLIPWYSNHHSLHSGQLLDAAMMLFVLLTMFSVATDSMTIMPSWWILRMKWFMIDRIAVGIFIFLDAEHMMNSTRHSNPPKYGGSIVCIQLIPMNILN